MLASVALPALLLIVPQVGLEEVRQALALASAPEGERKAFLEKYAVRFPSTAGEHVTAVEVFTPFREVMERAAARARLGNTYSETEALQEIGPRSAALRILIRVALSPGSVPVHPLVPLGKDFRVFVSYRPKGAGSARAVTEPNFTVSGTCQGVPCFQHDASTDGALLEASVPLAEGTSSSTLPTADQKGLLVVTVVAPSGASQTARFNLAELR